MRTILSVLFASATAALGFTPAFAADGDSFKLGVEGFYDDYREPATGVDNSAGYGSLTGTYAHDFGGPFGAIDGRASYGSETYSSPDGTDSDIPQWEFDGRVRGGVNLATEGGTFSPYMGLGVRYYIDEGKDTLTSLGYAGYDRRITQLYMPIGASYAYDAGNHWTITPTLEVDPLLWGNVNSRLQNDNGYNINNTQHDGYGLRGELMFGQKPPGSSTGWEFGPFVRYWNIKDSEVTTAPDGSQWIEPANNRLQVGAALRILFN